MYALIVYVCLTGLQCDVKDATPMMLANTIPGMMACQMSPRTQYTISEFRLNHPNWFVHLRYTCTPASEVGRFLGRNQA